jgi:tRNA(fMet)-specific endonuclease VapC
MFCLDTHIIIYALNRRRPEFAARISEELRAGRPLIVPAIVRYELEYGFAKSERRAANRAILESLLARGFEQHVFDTEDAH